MQTELMGRKYNYMAGRATRDEILDYVIDLDRNWPFVWILGAPTRHLPAHPKYLGKRTYRTALNGISGFLRRLVKK
jgi:hypothetical protein